MEKCTNCNGIGTILIGTIDERTFSIECPVCNGKGYVGTREDE